MPGNLELLKAFELFGNAMQDFNQASAVRQINEKLGDLTAQERAVTSELENARAGIGTTPTPEQREGIENLQKQATGFLDQRKSLAGQATRRLTALGLPVAQTQAVAQSIFQGPSAVQLQTEGQLELQERKFEFEREQAALDRPIEAAEKAEKKSAKAVETSFKRFNAFGKNKANENLLTSLEQGRSAKGLLEGSDLATAVSIVQRQLIRASGDQRPSDKDVDAFNFTPDMKEDLVAGFYRKAFGRMSTEEKERALGLLEVLNTNTVKVLKKKARQFSKFGHKGTGQGAQEFNQALLENFGVDLKPGSEEDKSLKESIFQTKESGQEELSRGGTVGTGQTPAEAATFTFQ